MQLTFYCSSQLPGKIFQCLLIATYYHIFLNTDSAIHFFFNRLLFCAAGGVDKAVTAIFQYSGHRTAVINTSFICSLDNEATVCCSKMVNDTYSAIVKVRRFA